LGDILQDTPLLDWLPVRDIELQPLVPGAELVCVMLGMLIPCLLGFCIIRATSRRLLFLLLVFACGMGVTALSAALSYGPEHAWAWFSVPVKAGLSAALVLLALGVHLDLLNQAPASPYFAQTLSTWEQGRFIRFHGLAQWVGWLWPYATLVYVLFRVWVRDAKN
jgi:hypothetical protein